ncbi:c-type cytochrome [Helicobacter jaachi]|uniref:C-type cytochrome n=1 Tax=Helicobacter jaachi TaxID=1677920 RepID=A0A4U8TCJ5_9HELI|nr:c-type cytochrome [Helicobacter jaachi]TLD97700.1 c-type cytochrome [Helicobacter jaachi]
MTRNICICIVALCLVACSNEQDTQKTSPKKVSIQNQDSQSTQSASNSALPDASVLYSKCASCHGKDGKSIAPGSVGNVLLASLNKQQVIESLKGFRARTLSRGGNSVIMYMQAKNLSDDDIEALAAYIDAL